MALFGSQLYNLPLNNSAIVTVNVMVNVEVYNYNIILSAHLKVIFTFYSAINCLPQVMTVTILTTRGLT